MRRAALCLCLFALLAGCSRGPKPPLVGSPAPQFSVTDADRTVALKDLRGQVVVLNFWATWCPPCVEEMPSLVQMQKQLKGSGVTVLAVSLDDDARQYHSFLEKNKVDLLTVRDPRQQSNELYGTFKFPETYIIDRQGVLRRKFIGAVDWTKPDVLDYLRKL